MAGPQFITPQPVQPSRPTRRFTLAEANRALPLVSRIVRDIMKAHAAALNLQRSLEIISASREQLKAQDELQNLLDRLADLVDELAEVGCELKDPAVGLIDFIGRHQGRDVYLCWKFGEKSVSHWHELQGGFAGRRPVSLLDEGSA